MRRSCLLAFASLAMLVAASRTAQAQYVSAYTACAPPDSVYVIWLAYDPSPAAYPDWVGYDVMRRVLPGCNDFVQANQAIIPRAGITTIYFQELAPPAGSVVEYRVRAVDVNHQEQFIPGFCTPCQSYLNCPQFSSPITVGTLISAGGFVYVTPCPGTCYPAPYLDPQTAAQLAPYVGTSTTFRFFGQVTCGGVEGCSMSVDHWETSTCVTSTTVSSWGRIKTIYR
jgi:hypothetical protein